MKALATGEHEVFSPAARTGLRMECRPVFGVQPREIVW